LEKVKENKNKKTRQAKQNKTKQNESLFVFFRQTIYFIIIFRTRQIGDFLRVLRFPSSINKTDRHDVIEILLKVELNTIKQTKQIKYGT
jgi:hypothetical protein